jgi:hypothetical protein
LWTAASKGSTSNLGIKMMIKYTIKRSKSITILRIQVLEISKLEKRKKRV